MKSKMLFPILIFSVIWQKKMRPLVTEFPGCLIYNSCFAKTWIYSKQTHYCFFTFILVQIMRASWRSLFPTYTKTSLRCLHVVSRLVYKTSWGHLKQKSWRRQLQRCEEVTRRHYFKTPLRRLPDALPIFFIQFLLQLKLLC